MNVKPNDMVTWLKLIMNMSREMNIQRMSLGIAMLFVAAKHQALTNDGFVVLRDYLSPTFEKAKDQNKIKKLLVLLKNSENREKARDFCRLLINCLLRQEIIVLPEVSLHPVVSGDGSIVMRRNSDLNLRRRAASGIIQQYGDQDAWYALLLSPGV